MARKMAKPDKRAPSEDALRVQGNILVQQPWSGHPLERFAHGGEALTMRSHRIHGLRRSAFYRLFECQPRPDVVPLQPGTQARVVDVALGAEHLRPDTTSRLPQVQFDDAIAVMLDRI